MSTDLIVMRSDGMKISFSPNVEELKETAIMSGALIGKVDSTETNAAATQALLNLKAFEVLVEKSRKVVKEPFLDACRKIDDLARTMVEDVKAESCRVAQITADWQMEQSRKIQALERARLAEITRIEREKVEELSKAATPEAKQVIEARSQQEVIALPPPPASANAKGQVVKPVVCFEVTDIHLLYKMHPGLVKIEVRTQEINDVLATGIRTIAGLRVWEETKVSVRLGHGKVVDV